MSFVVEKDAKYKRRMSDRQIVTRRFAEYPKLINVLRVLPQETEKTLEKPSFLVAKGLFNVTESNLFPFTLDGLFVKCLVLSLVLAVFKYLI